MFGERLKTLRNQKKWTQDEVAKKIGVKRATYGHYESNKNQPDFETLCKLAELFDVTIDYIVGYNLEKTKQLKAALDQKYQKTIDLSDDEWLEANSIEFNGKSLSKEHVKLIRAFIRALQSKDE